jgi:tryptophan synthase alpha chain
MGYYNPIYSRGVDRFLADAKAAGVDGLIVVDLPPEEDERAVPARAGGGAELHPPGHPHNRRQAPAQGAAEHLGLRLLRLDHRDHRRGGGAGGRCRPRGGADQGATDLPVIVGFGITTPEAARRSPAWPMAAWSDRPSWQDRAGKPVAEVLAYVPRWPTGRIAAETGATRAALPLNPIPQRKAPCPFGQGAKISGPVGHAKRCQARPSARPGT